MCSLRDLQRAISITKGGGGALGSEVETEVSENVGMISGEGACVKGTSERAESGIGELGEDAGMII